MSIAQPFGPSLTLAALQILIDDLEPGDGPVDGLSVETRNSAQFTSVVFDTGIILEKPVSTLVISGSAAPSNTVLFAQGQCFIQNKIKDVDVHVLLDENMLAARCISVLQSFGWSREQAIGITANIKYESGYNPRNVGDSGTAYGLCQWRGSRQSDFATAFNKSLTKSTFRDQLTFIAWELGHTEHVAGDDLRSKATVDDSAASVCRNYERPKNPDADTPLRVAYARRLAGIPGVA